MRGRWNRDWVRGRAGWYFLVFCDGHCGGRELFVSFCFGSVELLRAVRVMVMVVVMVMVMVMMMVRMRCKCWVLDRAFPIIVTGEAHFGRRDSWRGIEARCHVVSITTSAHDGG